MAVAETAQLVVQLRLQDEMSGALRSASASAAGAASQMTSHFGRVGGAVSKLGGALGHARSQIGSLVTGPLGMVGLAGGAFGVATALEKAVGSAMSFQQQMELVRTQAGATQGEVDSMSTAVLGMARSMGTAPEQLAMGLYHVESAGFRGAKALDLLRVAAEGAKVGNADLESVTNALVAADQSGIRGVQDLAGAMGTLNGIVGAGNMRMQDLADAFASGILPAAKTFGISLQSVGAALATLTDEGVPANEAATRLRMTLSLLGAPTAKAAKDLKSIGLSSLDLANAMRSPGGLVAAVGLLRDHMVKAGLIGPDGSPNSKGAQLLSNAFGGGRSSATIMTLVGNFGLLEAKQKAVIEGQNQFNDAWAATQATVAFKWQQFLATLGTVGVKIGNVLLGPALDALNGLSDWIDRHQDDLVNFFKSAADAGRTVVGVITTVAGKIGSIWSSIPEPMRNLLVGGFAVQKASSWLLGSGPLDWGKSLLQTLLGRLGPAGGLLSGAVGGDGARVFVTNWPAGMGIGGGGVNPVGVGEAAGGIGAFLTSTAGLGVIGAVAAAALAYEANQGYQNWKATHPNDNSIAPSSTQTQDRQTRNPALWAVQQRNRAAAAAANEAAWLGTAPVFDRGWSVDAQGRTIRITPKFDSGWGVDAQGRTVWLASQSTNAVAGAIAGAMVRTIRPPLDALHRDYQQQTHVLRKSADPQAIIRAALKAMHDVQRGVGSAAGTRSLLDLLLKDRKLIAATGDAKLLRQIDAAIQAVRAKLPNREFVAQQIALAKRIAASTESADKKDADLKRIQQNLLSHGDRSAARQVQAIRENRPIVSTAVTTNVSVTAGGIQRTVSVSQRYGRATGSFAGKPLPLY